MQELPIEVYINDGHVSRILKAYTDSVDLAHDEKVTFTAALEILAKNTTRQPSVKIKATCNPLNIEAYPILESAGVPSAGGYVADTSHLYSRLRERALLEFSGSSYFVLLTALFGNNFMDNLLSLGDLQYYTGLFRTAMIFGNNEETNDHE